MKYLTANPAADHDSAVGARLSALVRKVGHAKPGLGIRIILYTIQSKQVEEGVALC